MGTDARHRLSYRFPGARKPYAATSNGSHRITELGVYRPTPLRIHCREQRHPRHLDSQRPSSRKVAFSDEHGRIVDEFLDAGDYRRGHAACGGDGAAGSQRPVASSGLNRLYRQACGAFNWSAADRQDPAALNRRRADGFVRSLSRSGGKARDDQRQMVIVEQGDTAVVGATGPRGVRGSDALIRNQQAQTPFRVHLPPFASQLASPWTPVASTSVVCNWVPAAGGVDRPGSGRSSPRSASGQREFS
jgi:hypothetical protein